MKLTHDELEFLSAWAREEWEPACYELPAHRLQMAHGIAGAQLILFIKAWTEGERKKDQEILAAAANSHPRWPWSTMREFAGRLAEASSGIHNQTVCTKRSDEDSASTSSPREFTKRI